VILMVSGMTTLVAVLDKAGGLDLFTALLARLASPRHRRRRDRSTRPGTVGRKAGSTTPEVLL
jgi:hypothetical protein